jgi:hypothetical protein
MCQFLFSHVLLLRVLEYAEDHLYELEAPTNCMWSMLESKKEESNNTPALEVIAVFMRDGVNQWGNKAREV